MLTTLVLCRAPQELQAEVPDGLPRDAIELALRTAFGHISGFWSLSLQRCYPNQWRLELRGPTGRHIWIFFSPTDGLPDVVRDKLIAFVHASTARYLRRVALAS